MVVNMSLIQDFRDWKKARYALQLVVRHINCFKENLVQECDELTWRANIANKELFEKTSLPNDFNAALNTLMHVHNYMNQTNKLAQKYRASSCFYTFDKEEGKCINLSFNRTITDKRCVGCDKYFLLKSYQRIFAELRNKEQICEAAKQKFFSNFIFWKQKAK